MTHQKMPRSSPEAQGVRSQALISFLDRLERDGQQHHSFMLIRHGKVIAEGSWKPYSLDDSHMLFSLSKSFTSTAIGFAVNEGLLKLEDSVAELFHDELPENFDHGYEKITVRHLLTMSTGQERDPTFDMQWHETWVKGFFSMPLTHAPGTRFIYNSGATYMLSAIVQKLTGQRLTDYLMPRLFQPLGILRPFWQQSPQGIDAGGWGLYLKVEDIARFGQMYLNKGVFNGVRILPETWVNASTAMQVANEGFTVDWSSGYGYQFWRCQHGAYRGDGAFGQFCVVMPEQDAVLAATNGFHDMQRYLDAVWEELLPEMSHPGPLPEDDGAHGKLLTRLESLEHMPPATSLTLPFEQTVRGREYTAFENKYGLKRLQIDFSDDKCMFRFEDETGAYSITAGRSQWHKSITHMKSSIGGPIMMGAVEPPGYVPQPAFAAFKWIDGSTLHLCVRYSEAPTNDEWMLTFKGETVSAVRKLSAAFEWGEREAVTFTVK